MLKYYALVSLFLPLTTLADVNNITIPVELNQNAFHYFQGNLNKPVISKTVARQKYKQFLRNFFYQWSPAATQSTFCYAPDYPQTCQSVKDLENGTIQYYQGKSGYGRHYQLHTSNWLNAIANNMDLNAYPNVHCTHGNSCRGIVVHNAQVRSMPTHDAFYNDFTIPGEGYPFDYIQLSDIWLGDPVMILQHSRDHQWFLVKTEGVLGWVPAHDIAKVTPAFIRRWQQIPLATSMQRNQTLFVDHSPVSWNMGGLLALRADHLGIPIKTHNGFAKVVFVNASTAQYQPWPLKPSIKNFSLLINALDGMPYGWGGMNFYSDCSSLMRRLFIGFGVWLPRASTWQAKYAGKETQLGQEPTSKRQAWLIHHQGPQHLTPLFTLVTYGHSVDAVSHVSVYLGSRKIDGQSVALIFQTPWGLHYTVPGSSNSGRAIIGQSLISRIGMGADIVPALKAKGWSTTTLWNVAGFNVTDLTQAAQPTQQPTLVQQSESQRVKAYLLNK